MIKALLVDPLDSLEVLLPVDAKLTRDSHCHVEVEEEGSDADEHHYSVEDVLGLKEFVQLLLAFLIQTSIVLFDEYGEVCDPACQLKEKPK